MPALPPTPRLFLGTLFGDRGSMWVGGGLEVTSIACKLGNCSCLYIQMSLCMWLRKASPEVTQRWLFFGSFFVVLLKLDLRFYINMFSIPWPLTSLQDLTQKHLQDLWNYLLLWQTCISPNPFSSSRSCWTLTRVANRYTDRASKTKGMGQGEMGIWEDCGNTKWPEILVLSDIQGHCIPLG